MVAVPMAAAGAAQEARGLESIPEVVVQAPVEEGVAAAGAGADAGAVGGNPASPVSPVSPVSPADVEHAAPEAQMQAPPELSERPVPAVPGPVTEVRPGPAAAPAAPAAPTS
jgi:hypothetical protein